MHSTRAHHHHLFGPHWSVSNVAITLLLGLLFLLLLLLLVVGTAQPAYAQSSVPPTARQAAATMPQFAAKLRAGMAHAASRTAQGYQLQAPYRNPLRSSQHGSLPTDNIVYNNGPINGTTDAWTINFGFIVSNTFTIPSSGANLTSLSFGAWLSPGDVLLNAEVSITDSEYGGNTYFDGIVSFTQDGCIGNQYGFNVCTETGNFTMNNLDQGTYWINLQNATVNTGDPVYWDENSGPSLAFEDSVGTIPSEAFTLLGGATTTTCYFDCPPECVHDRPQNGFQVVHEFSDEEQSPAAGLALDQAGNLYGAASGGTHGAGLAYRLDPDSIFTPLYNFIGGSSGQNPWPDIIGPEGALYGAANGGFQNCGSSGTEYCGLIYRLRPSPSICPIALCGWNETVTYRFTGEPDGWKPNGNLVFDQAGNLYGTTAKGGTYGQGTVFQLTPFNGGWTEKIIHSFTGTQPTSMLVAQDGSLYGTTDADGVIFQLTPSGDSWTFTTIAGFGPCGPWGCPNPRLTQTMSGNLYGLVQYGQERCSIVGCFWWAFGQIFLMSPSQTGWKLTVLGDTGYCSQNECGYDPGYFVFRNLVVDAAGNIYGSSGIAIGSPYYDYGGGVFKLLQPYESQGLVGFRGDDFFDLELDASGRLYGTTGACGSSRGTIWRLTPP